MCEIIKDANPFWINYFSSDDKEVFNHNILIKSIVTIDNNMVISNLSHDILPLIISNNSQRILDIYGNYYRNHAFSLSTYRAKKRTKKTWKKNIKDVFTGFFKDLKDARMTLMTISMVGILFGISINDFKEEYGSIFIVFFLLLMLFYLLQGHFFKRKKDVVKNGVIEDTNIVKKYLKKSIIDIEKKSQAFKYKNNSKHNINIKRVFNNYKKNTSLLDSDLTSVTTKKDAIKLPSSNSKENTTLFSTLQIKSFITSELNAFITEGKAMIRKQYSKHKNKHELTNKKLEKFRYVTDSLRLALLSDTNISSVTQQLENMLDTKGEKNEKFIILATVEAAKFIKDNVRTQLKALSKELYG